MKVETILHALLQIWDELPELTGSGWPQLYSRLEAIHPKLVAASNSSEAAAAINLDSLFEDFPLARLIMNRTVQKISGEPRVFTRGRGPIRGGNSAEASRWADLVNGLRECFNPPSHIRYTDVSAPQKMALGKREHIIVGIKPFPLTDSSDALPIRLRRNEKLEILLHANPDDFTVDGENVKTLVVKRDQVAESVVFPIRGLSLGEKSVRIDFRRAGIVVATINLVIEVVPDRATTQQFSTPITMGGPYVPPPDLEILVRVESKKSGEEINYVLHSPSGVAPFHNLPVRGVRLRGSVEDFQRRTMAEMESLMRGEEADGSPLSPERIADRLSAIGRNLYHELFSPEMKSCYRQFNSIVSTILVTSDEPWIPWELIKPYDDSDLNNRIDDDFLCMKYQLTRWLTGGAGPMGRIAVRRMAVIEAAAAPGQTRIPYAGAEREYLSRLASSYKSISDDSPAAPTFKALDNLLMQGGIDLYHFAAHGNFDFKSPNGAQILLADGQMFKAQDLHGERQTQLAKDRPLVFLNACRVGQQGWSITQLGGWAAALARQSRCGAFIGPLWEVDDLLAYKFASAFYQSISEGESIGMATQKARKRVRSSSPDNPTWLAYSVYAHPNARVAFSSEAVR